MFLQVSDLSVKQDFTAFQMFFVSNGLNDYIAKVIRSLSSELLCICCVAFYSMTSRILSYFSLKKDNVFFESEIKSSHI